MSLSQAVRESQVTHAGKGNETLKLVPGHGAARTSTARTSSVRIGNSQRLFSDLLSSTFRHKAEKSNSEANLTFWP